MNTRRILAALLAAPLVIAILGGTPARAVPDGKLSISDVRLSKAAVSVSGLGTTAIDVTVQAGYDSDDPRDQDTTLYVYLQRTGGSGQIDRVVSTKLKRTAGTLKNGTWTGPLNVVSTANGTWKVSSVDAGPYGVDTGIDPTPYAGPTLHVTGTHAPRIGYTVTPETVPVGKPYSIKWTVTDSATGKPFGIRVSAWVSVDSPCAEGGGQPIKTDAAGNYTKTYQPGDANWLNCFVMETDPYPSVISDAIVHRLSGVSAIPAKTSAKVGTNVAVNGSVTGPPARCAINLQRLYGASQWRTVNSATVRDSGRYTLTATPSYRGKIPYRVQLPDCYRFVLATSKPFTITGV
ncbi:hypothetical protein E1263_23280 [Kribbella antibiotica]|uniref:Ig-like domain repeat protein n=1 Tax=Kribbella antibiotica TaxID=190195 RepID=A0A4R4ZHJ6_9ACTN|nr:hypothetical protein [Kribbella antibiotica]TDD57516.1 hypothetical protein E1263_23280 [Kribbella antibiotica]